MMEIERWRARAGEQMSRRKDNPQGVDELYGLEPVFEPGDDEAAGGPGGLQWRVVQCPYCGESFETGIDLSSGSTSYIEDCQVCCQPIEFSLEIKDDGSLVGLQLGRSE